MLIINVLDKIIFFLAMAVLTPKPINILRYYAPVGVIEFIKKLRIAKNKIQKGRHEL